MSSDRLTPTSYLILGLLAREGPSTPYDLERHVKATLGNFWSFPHTLLYTVPPRLAGERLVTESRERKGRRRRVFSITDAGREALAAWLERPSGEPTELRDLGLLQLFFADLGAPEARVRLAGQQLAIHRVKLSAYEAAVQGDGAARGTRPVNRTAERWRGETLRMGVLYEKAAVDFWQQVADAPDGASPARRERVSSASRRATRTSAAARPLSPAAAASDRPVPRRESPASNRGTGTRAAT
jgi:DNA-binding PadR family transcriptional regulator